MVICQFLSTSTPGALGLLVIYTGLSIFVFLAVLDHFDNFKCFWDVLTGLVVLPFGQFWPFRQFFFHTNWSDPSLLFHHDLINDVDQVPTVKPWNFRQFLLLDGFLIFLTVLMIMSLSLFDYFDSFSRFDGFACFHRLW